MTLDLRLRMATPYVLMVIFPNRCEKALKVKKVVTSEYVTCYKNENLLNPSYDCEFISGTVLICEKISLRVTCR